MGQRNSTEAMTTTTRPTTATGGQRNGGPILRAAVVLRSEPVRRDGSSNPPNRTAAARVVIDLTSQNNENGHATALEHGIGSLIRQTIGQTLASRGGSGSADGTSLRRLLLDLNSRVEQLEESRGTRAQQRVPPPPPLVGPSNSNDSVRQTRAAARRRVLNGRRQQAARQPEGRPSIELRPVASLNWRASTVSGAMDSRSSRDTRRTAASLQARENLSPSRLINTRAAQTETTSVDERHDNSEAPSVRVTRSMSRRLVETSTRRVTRSMAARREHRDDATRRSSTSPNAPPGNKIAASGRSRKRKASENIVPRKCCICLSDSEPSEVSSIDSCDHTFCFECIEKWAEFENTCPLCKLRFTKISRVCNSKRSKSVPHTSQRSDLQILQSLFPTFYENVRLVPIYDDVLQHVHAARMRANQQDE